VVALNLPELIIGGPDGGQNVGSEKDRCVLLLVALKPYTKSHIREFSMVGISQGMVI